MRRLGCCCFGILVGFMVPDSAPRASAESAVVTGHVAGKPTDHRALYAARCVSRCCQPTAGQSQRKSGWNNRKFHLRPPFKHGISRQRTHRVTDKFNF